MRSWEQTEESGRKTLQRADIAQTIPKADMYDFLIDIVPRDEHRPCRRGADDQLLPVHDFPQYFYQAMQHHQTQNSVSPSPSGSIGGGPSMSQVRKKKGAMRVCFRKAIWCLTKHQLSCYSHSTLERLSPIALHFLEIITLSHIRLTGGIPNLCLGPSLLVGIWAETE